MSQMVTYSWLTTTVYHKWLLTLGWLYWLSHSWRMGEPWGTLRAANCVSDAKVELQIRGLGVDPQRCARAHLESFGSRFRMREAIRLDVDAQKSCHFSVTQKGLDMFECCQCWYASEKCSILQCGALASGTSLSLTLSTSTSSVITCNYCRCAIYGYLST